MPKLGEVGTPAIKFEATGAFDEKPVKEKPLLAPGDIGPPNHDAVDAEEEKLAGKRLARRQELAGHPGKLEGAAAESFVQNTLTELSVDAVVELRYALKYGTAGERERARDRTLDATGNGKRDRMGGATQLIIVNGVGTLPWRGTAEVVDAAQPNAPKVISS